MFSTKFRCIWLSGLRGKDSDVKSERTTDDGRHVMANCDVT